METKQLKNIIEAALLASGEPLSLDSLLALFGKDNEMSKDDIRAVIKDLQEEYTVERRSLESGRTLALLFQFVCSNCF